MPFNHLLDPGSEVEWRAWPRSDRSYNLLDTDRDRRYDSRTPWRAPMAGNIEWDEDKNRRNQRYHGIDLSAAEGFEWETATVRVDDREDYGELREIAKGFIGDVLHVLVFTRRGDAVRVVSLRKATKKERKQYVEETR